MTDKEIIKALECCFSPYGCGDCPSPDKSCTDNDCAVSLSREAIALIKCYKFQIEDLYVALDERIQRIKELEAEVNRLQGHNLRMARKHYDDGVREFAERLKPTITRMVELMFDDNEGCCQIENCKKPDIIPCESPICVDENKEYWCGVIDTLVKEMTEDTDNGYFTKEESEAYQKALSDIAKPTGHNIFDDMEASDE